MNNDDDDVVEDDNDNHNNDDGAALRPHAKRCRAECVPVFLPVAVSSVIAVVPWSSVPFERKSVQWCDSGDGGGQKRNKRQAVSSSRFVSSIVLSEKHL